MMRKILIAGLLAASIALPALADARFSSLFYEDEHEFVIDAPERDVFLCPDEQEMEEFQRSGTGVVLLGSSENRWTRMSVVLVQEMCSRYGIGVVRYVDPAGQPGYAGQVQEYLSKWGTSFANVSGTTKLIEENIGCDASEIEGIVLFVNKGTILGAHVGSVEDAMGAAEETDAQMDAILEQMYVYLQKLGSSPCPNHC